ncbi:hypothetical protein [Streptomyces flavidovirens]|uniref:Uncharacterized protein n=1 Tax=Streptomyces flavidovirens TaxID=67298 RepID=A0ABW6RQ23_9ACTN
MSTDTHAVKAVLDASAQLTPHPGYINGDDYDDWYIPVTPALLRALAELARTGTDRDLADRLERYSHPLCMEPLDAVLPSGTIPKEWCGIPVQSPGDPCGLHVPQRAKDLRRCSWPGDVRICRTSPTAGNDRCSTHAMYCRAVKTDGKICNRWDCKVPKHRHASPAGA